MRSFARRPLERAGESTKICDRHRQETCTATGLEKAQTKLDEAKHAASEVAEAAKEKASALGEAASQAADNLTRRAQDVYSQGRSTAERVGHQMRQGYRSGAEQLEMAMREYPLAVAIGFAAAGALFGVLLPRTRPEDAFMGEKSDQLLDATKEKGQELLERGKAVAEGVAETAMDEARQQGFTPRSSYRKDIRNRRKGQRDRPQSY